MLFPEQIDTDRLTLERLCEENVDLFALYRICSSDPGIDAVTEYMPWDPHETVNETVEFVDGMDQQWQDGNGAHYVIRPKQGESGAGEIAGCTGLTCDWDRRTGRLGLWLRRRFWGRGYSGERASALMDLAFERLDLEVVAVTHHVDNEKSQRAIEKYIEAHGGRRDGLLRNWFHDGDRVADEYRYTVRQEEYREAVES